MLWDACPRNSETTCSLTPTCFNSFAKVCLREWKLFLFVLTPSNLRKPFDIKKSTHILDIAIWIKFQVWEQSLRVILLLFINKIQKSEFNQFWMNRYDSFWNWLQISRSNDAVMINRGVFAFDEMLAWHNKLHFVSVLFFSSELSFELVEMTLWNEPSYP